MASKSAHKVNNSLLATRSARASSLDLASFAATTSSSFLRTRRSSSLSASSTLARFVEGSAAPQDISSTPHGPPSSWSTARLVTPSFPCSGCLSSPPEVRGVTFFCCFAGEFSPAFAGGWLTRRWGGSLPFSNSKKDGGHGRPGEGNRRHGDERETVNTDPLVSIDKEGDSETRRRRLSLPCDPTEG